MKKAIIFASISASVIISSFLDWLLSKFYDSIITLTNLEIALNYVLEVLTYISGPYGYGLITGALFFCIWDLPIIGKSLRKWRSKRRNASEDSILADQCERMSQTLFEHSTTLERIHTESRWIPGTDHDITSSFEDTRTLQLRETDRFKSKFGNEIKSIFVKLKNRGLKIEMDDLRIIQWRFLDASVLFDEIASSLRSGSYLDGRTFNLKRDDS
ncbi:hypothetical protein [Pseudomonas putida]|uniref:hypothetical protein n=1 Tax=Pseudomonas putida TaxID=303 RepID=UPI000D37BF8F|nr:hypothetical protein [Pseudomonas putida]PTV65627.1 hypothetical protein DBL03_03535 [Pseudomonas putida]